MFTITKRAAASFIATAATGAIVLSGAAASASGTPARHTAAGQTISLYCHGGTSAFLNLAHKGGLAAGDEAIMSQPCDAAAHHTQLLGHGYVISTFESSNAATAHAILALNGGDIVLDGLESPNGPFTIAVTGGTGSYEGAHGQAAIAPQPGKGNPALVTISLLP